MKLVPDHLENILGKGENAGYNLSLSFQKLSSP